MVPFDIMTASRPVEEARKRPAEQQPAGASIAMPDPAVVSERRSFRRLISVTMITIDLCAMVIAFSIGNYLVYETSDVGQLGTVLAAALPIHLLFGLNNGAYSPRTGVKPGTSVFRGLGALILTAATLVLLVFLLKAGPQFSRMQFLIGFAASFALIAFLRQTMGSHWNARAVAGLFATLHIYDGVDPPPNAGPFHVDADSAGLSTNRHDLGAVNRIGMMAKGMDSVAVHCPADRRLKWAVALKGLDVPGEIVAPDLNPLGALDIVMRDGETSLVLSSGTLRWDQHLVKRIFDLSVTIALLPVMLVLLAIVAIAIRVDSRGPVFFRQDRIGIGSRRFRMWKFRSMYVDQADANAAQLTTRGDPRVTRVGAFLRRSSIDELPQLINVLAGDMSLVGPRPHASMAKAGSRLYWEVDENYWDRHVVKPGITGLAQVRGHRGNTFAEDHLRDRLQADLEYVAQWSLLLDLRILLATLAVPFHKNAF